LSRRRRLRRAFPSGPRLQSESLRRRQDSATPFMRVGTARVGQLARSCTREGVVVANAATSAQRSPRSRVRKTGSTSRKTRKPPTLDGDSTLSVRLQSRGSRKPRMARRCEWCRTPLVENQREDARHCSTACRCAANRKPGGPADRLPIGTDVHRVFLAVADGYSRDDLARLWTPANQDRAARAVKRLIREGWIYGGGHWGIVRAAVAEYPLSATQNGSDALRATPEGDWQGYPGERPTSRLAATVRRLPASLELR
jgi:hypothetical protein